MHLTLLESDRSLLRSAELVTLSLGVHRSVAALVAFSATGTFRLPDDERDARCHRSLTPRPPGGSTPIHIPI